MQYPNKNKPDPLLEEAKRKLARLIANGDWPSSEREERPRIKKREERPRIKRKSTFRYIPPEQIRHVSRHVLMRGLLEEIEKGCSLSKLYAALLAKTMLSDPKLRSKYRQRLMSLTE
jgi:hypothetical protein